MTCVVSISSILPPSVRLFSKLLEQHIALPSDGPQQMKDSKSKMQCFRRAMCHVSKFPIQICDFQLTWWIMLGIISFVKYVYVALYKKGDISPMFPCVYPFTQPGTSSMSTSSAYCLSLSAAHGVGQPARTGLFLVAPMTAKRPCECAMYPCMKPIWISAATFISTSSISTGLLPQTRPSLGRSFLGPPGGGTRVDAASWETAFMKAGVALEGRECLDGT